MSFDCFITLFLKSHSLLSSTERINSWLCIQIQWYKVGTETECTALMIDLSIIHSRWEIAEVLYLLVWLVGCLVGWLIVLEVRARKRNRRLPKLWFYVCLLGNPRITRHPVILTRQHFPQFACEAMGTSDKA